MVVWVYDSLGQIRLHPDFQRGRFRIRELTLLVPPER